jgi:hypothetical protein
LPDAEAFEEAEREVVALGGCLLPEQPAAFVCRSCGLEWGSESDFTVGEAELIAPLDVGFSDLVRALGTGWRRRRSPAPGGTSAGSSAVSRPSSRSGLSGPGSSSTGR